MSRPPEKVRTQPRISVNELALYMVSSETAKVRIVQRSKFPQGPLVIRYRDVRPVICSYLTDPARKKITLANAEEMFRQRTEDNALSPLVRDDAAQSLEVIQAIYGMANKLGPLDFQLAPRDQDKIYLAGVEISARADLIVHGASRSEPQIGAAVLRMTVDDGETEAARERRKAMGLYAATLMRIHVDKNIQSERTPSNRLCMSIDIQHGEIFSAPLGNQRRMSDLENACRMIAAIWPTLQ